MIDQLIKYRCPSCDQAVLNRRIKHCLYCSSVLPPNILLMGETNPGSDQDANASDGFANGTIISQTKEKQIHTRRRLAKGDFEDLDSNVKDDERTESSRIMDALAGGLIGLIALVVVFSFVFRLAPSVYSLIVIVGTLVAIVGSYFFGAKFLDGIFSFFDRR